jgi:CRP-like cAMP-binding protein
MTGEFLPTKRAVEFAKGQTIYEPTCPARYLYLVISGRVRISVTDQNGAQVLLRLACPEDIFGESSLVLEEHAPPPESAVTLTPVQVMAWSPEEVERNIESQPALSLRLMKFAAQRNAQLQNRLNSFFAYNTAKRVAIALVELARGAGQRTPEGALRLNGLTHRDVAEYAGTTREIVTSEMNRLRRVGYLQYSRGCIDVFGDALVELMREQGVTAFGEQASVGARR